VFTWLKRLIAPAPPAPEPAPAPPPLSAERQAAQALAEAFHQFVADKYSVVQDSKALPHPKADLQRALRGELRAALEARDWPAYDRLKADAIMLTNFQDFGLCKAREQSPETVMVSEVRLLMTELDDMAMRLGEPPAALRTGGAGGAEGPGRN
jgi:hypothetical protein